MSMPRTLRTAYQTSPSPDEVAEGEQRYEKGGTRDRFLDCYEPTSTGYRADLDCAGLGHVRCR